MTKLDEISRVIGGMEESLKSLGRSMDRDREVADDRHRENTDSLQQIGVRVGDLEGSVRPLAASVKRMEPVFESILVTRWKLAGALALAGFLITGIGWLLVLLVDKLGAWFWSTFLPK